MYRQEWIDEEGNRALEESLMPRWAAVTLVVVVVLAAVGVWLGWLR
jgi:hypothetical protein